MKSEDVNELRRALATIVPALVPALVLAPAAVAQDAAQIQPRAYRVLIDNDRVRVLEFNSRPGMGVCGSGKHSHPAHLTVALTAARLRVKLPDGKEIVAENKPGDVFWSEAESHETENIGGQDIRALIIELKGSATG